MIGLMILLALLVYLVISVGVVKWTVRWARRTGRSAWRWGVAAGFAMYLLVSWDQIPTLLLHKYYCATKAGFWVYKTPEQWKAENPGVAETLTWQESSPSFDNPDGSFGFRLNERFIYITQQWNAPILPITVSTDSIIDEKTAEVMVKRVRVGSGYNAEDDLRVFIFWVNPESCLPNQTEIGQLRTSFKKIGRKVK